MLLKQILIFSLIAISFIGISDQAFAEPQNLIASSHGTEISLMFTDGVVSGVIVMEDHTINLNDVKVIERNDRLLIIDKQNDLKILSKQLSLDKYIVIVKINFEDIQTKLRFVTSSESAHKNTGQRNLFDAMEQKTLEEQKESTSTLTYRELQLLEKQEVLDKALKVRDERLAKIAEEEAETSDESQTPKSIIEEWRASQISTGMGLILQEETEEVEIVEEIVVSHINLETFLSVPHHQEWKKILRFGVLVTDDSGHRYDPSYNEFIGNELSDVQISGTIKNPENSLIHSFNGTTDMSGEYLGTFLIPDRSTTNGEYVISVDAVKTFTDNTIATSSDSEVFFVTPSNDGGSANLPPTP